MKRSLAITAAAALLVLSLTACGANRADGMPDTDDIAGGTTATDTMRNSNSTTGTGTASGAAANTDTTANRANNGLGGVTGALNRSGRGTAPGNGSMSGSVYGVGGPNSSVYTATNNGGMISYADEAAVKRAAAEGDRYARMLENARVHDRDGFLLDGENTSYRTY